MDVTGLGWCGTRTEYDEQLANFYEHVLGLTPVRAEPGISGDRTATSTS
jgi:hypothetical protein